MSPGVHGAGLTLCVRATEKPFNKKNCILCTIHVIYYVGNLKHLLQKLHDVMQFLSLFKHTLTYYSRYVTGITQFDHFCYCFTGLCELEGRNTKLSENLRLVHVLVLILVVVLVFGVACNVGRFSLKLIDFIFTSW